MTTNEWLDRLTGGLRGQDKAALAAQGAGGVGKGGFDLLGGDRLADALDAMRALAMTAEAANAELDAIEAGWLPDEGGTAEIEALDRAVKAESALVLHVRAFDAGLALLAEVERGRRRVDAALNGLRARAQDADGKEN